MHTALREGPLFYKKTPPHFPLFTKNPFHFLSMGLLCTKLDLIADRVSGRGKAIGRVRPSVRFHFSFELCVLHDRAKPEERTEMLFAEADLCGPKEACAGASVCPHLVSK